MQVPSPDNQDFTDSTLRGFLLKNVDLSATGEVNKQLNTYLINRVDAFWESVVIPLKEAGNFNGNKINWYFEVYKEGLDARRVVANPFNFINVTVEQVTEIVAFFQKKTIVEYCELGTSYLSNSYSLLSFWYRDMLVLHRLKNIYYSENPYDWIIVAEKEEHGAMTEKPVVIDGLTNVISNISMILSKRI